MILDYVTSKSGGIFLAPLEVGNAYNVSLGIRKEIKNDPSITVEKVKGKDIEQLMKVLNEAPSFNLLDLHNLRKRRNQDNHLTLT